MRALIDGGADPASHSLITDVPLMSLYTVGVLLDVDYFQKMGPGSTPLHFAIEELLMMKATLRRERDRAVLASTALTLNSNSGSALVDLLIHDEFLPLSPSDSYQLLTYVFVAGSPTPNYDYAIVSDLQKGLTQAP